MTENKKPKTKKEWSVYRYNTCLKLAIDQAESANVARCLYLICRAIEELPAMIEGKNIEKIKEVS